LRERTSSRPEPWADPWGFYPAQCPRSFSLLGLSTHSLSLLSRVLQLWCRRLGLPERRLPPLRFLPLRRFPVRGQPLSSRGYQPSGSGAFSAFLTLSRLSSAHELPALFHAGPVLGVLPFRVCFHSRSCTFSRRSLPSCGWRVFVLCCFGLPGYVTALGCDQLSQAYLVEAASRKRAPLQGLAPRERPCPGLAV